MTPLQITPRALGAAAFNNEFGRSNLAGYFRTFESETSEGGKSYHGSFDCGGFGIREDQVYCHPLMPAKLVVLGGPAMPTVLVVALLPRWRVAPAQKTWILPRNAKIPDAAALPGGYRSLLGTWRRQSHSRDPRRRCWRFEQRFPRMVKDGGRGGRFELREIPSDEPGMSLPEIWCNESQNATSWRSRQMTCRLSDLRSRAPPLAVVGEATSATS